jgi:hypothetical protein
MSVFNVGFVIFPELTQLDFTGPQQVLARLPQSAMHIIAKSGSPVPSDSGLSLVPTVLRRGRLPTNKLYRLPISHRLNDPGTAAWYADQIQPRAILKGMRKIGRVVVVHCVSRPGGSGRTASQNWDQNEGQQNARQTLCLPCLLPLFRSWFAPQTRESCEVLILRFCTNTSRDKRLQ